MAGRKWGIDIPLLCAGSLPVLAPSVALVLVFQRQFVAALMQGAFKGRSVAPPFKRAVLAREKSHLSCVNTHLRCVSADPQVGGRTGVAAARRCARGER